MQSNKITQGEAKKSNIDLTEGSVDTPLDGLEGVRHLDGAHDGELLLEVLLQGGSEDALGVALGLEGGGVVDLVGGGEGAEALLGGVVHLASQDQVLHGGVGEQQLERREVVLGAHGGEAHVGHGVGHAEADRHLVGHLAVVLGTSELGGEAAGERAGAGADGGLGLGQTVDIELTSHGGVGVGVLEGQVGLVGVVALELELEAGEGVHEGSLHGQLEVVGELELLQGETGSMGVLKGHLGLQGLLALLVDNLDVGGKSLLATVNEILFRISLSAIKINFCRSHTVAKGPADLTFKLSLVSKSSEKMSTEN